MNLNLFLVKAKRATYANETVETKVLDDGRKELTYEEGEFKYQDRYRGFDPFEGKEVVFQDGKEIWSMTYKGGTTTTTLPVKEVYAFLREAMRHVTTERPFRGPEMYKKEDFEYKDKSEGDIEKFSGNEQIFFKGEEVYRLNYNGKQE